MTFLELAPFVFLGLTIAYCIMTIHFMNKLTKASREREELRELIRKDLNKNHRV